MTTTTIINTSEVEEQNRLLGDVRNALLFRTARAGDVPSTASNDEAYSVAARYFTENLANVLAVTDNAIDEFTRSIKENGIEVAENFSKELKALHGAMFQAREMAVKLALQAYH